MGSQIAQALAEAGYEVALVDVSEEILERARDTIQQGVRMRRLLRTVKTDSRPAEPLDRISFAVDYDMFTDVEVVVETVTEDWETKRRVYEALDRVCEPGCMFATNTSVIPVTKIASATRRAPQVIGTHFMNPVSLSSMVEVIRGYHTSPDTLQATQDLLTRLGKQAIVVNDAPGFVTNRVLMLTVNEAVFVVQDHLASAEDVDRLFKNCFGHKMGPLETADLIGLDTVLRSIELLYESFGDSKYRPCPLLKHMVDAGLYGRKSGQGFYQYPMSRGCEGTEGRL